MQVLKGKKKFFFLFLLLFLTTTQIDQKNTFPIFKIKRVIFINAKNFEENLKNNLRDALLNKSLLNFNTQKINMIFDQSNWVRSYKIKKKYPREIFFEIIEYKPIAIIQKKGKFFLVNDNFMATKKVLIKKDNINLITILGDYKIQSFKNLYLELIKFIFFEELKIINFLNLDRIELLLKNNIKIKLGNYNFKNQLTAIDQILKTKKNLQLIDLRIEGLVITR